MNELTRLFDLQQTDTNIQTKKQRLAEVLGSLKEPDELAAVKQTVERLTESISQLSIQQKDLELQLAGVNDKKKASSDRMYSGNVKSSRELADLQKEVESLTKRASGLEDDVLTVMAEKEEVEIELTESNSQQTTIQDAWSLEEMRLNEEKQALASDLHQLLTNRKEQVEKIDTKMLTRYDLLRKKGKGLAVTTLKRPNICTGCLLTLSSTDIKKIEEGQIVYCTNCNRIVVDM